MHLCEHISGELIALSTRTAELRAIAAEAEGAADIGALEALLARARTIQVEATGEQQHLERTKLNVHTELLRALGGRPRDWNISLDEEDWVTSVRRMRIEQLNLPDRTLDLSGLERCPSIDLSSTDVAQPTFPAGVTGANIARCRSLDPEVDLSMYTSLKVVELSNTHVTRPTLPAGVVNVGLFQCMKLDQEIDLSMYKRLNMVDLKHSSVRCVALTREQEEKRRLGQLRIESIREITFTVVDP